MFHGDLRTAAPAGARPSGPRLRPVPDLRSPEDLGPQHAHIVALIRALAGVSAEQDQQIEAVWYELRGPRRFAARGTISDSASRSGRLEAQLQARQRTWAASSLRCRDAAADAALALVVRDLVGTGPAHEAYDQLTWPWASVMGPAHPDDTPSAEGPQPSR